MQKTIRIADERGYAVLDVKQAKIIANEWLDKLGLAHSVKFGLPEIDDRRHYWRVPLCANNGGKTGEIVIDAYSAKIISSCTTQSEILCARLLKQDNIQSTKKKKDKKIYKLSSLRNTVGVGDSAQLLEEMPAESVELIFTSPPYFNARPEYSEYEEYDEYLFKMRQIIRSCHRVLAEGRFFIINISPVLLRRASRNEASKRIAVPYDFHRLFIEEGYDFIDDIIWLKPEGAGWATGRGRRFAADRNPLQYKAVPVTEYVLVYRKRTDLLIDWFIRNYPDKTVLEDSKIQDGYERTNVWRIHPSTNSRHPAAFPKELAEKVIRYYSFKSDVVLDPFAGSGIVGNAASQLQRRFVLFDNNPNYIEIIKEDMTNWKNIKLSDVAWINCEPPNFGYE